MSESNGAVVIVPGSHRVPVRSSEDHPRFSEERWILAKPGQVVICNGCLYHRGAANNSKRKRRVCLMCY
ncbi:MAG: hypothetical protein CME19_01000 [Gemmatimonadetes bacterium]|nr:hypothetical protein [Gemmatimonadota bacterium]